jgi:ribosomal protein L11 methyltransferase
MQRDRYHPFSIGDRFRIVPPDTPPIGDRIDLIMTRGAFGSGEHETTASCLEIMEMLENEVQDASVLDLGSGTGILAIAAVKLGAARAMCVEIDPAAAEIGEINGRINGVADQLDHLTGQLADVAEGRFDLILANLYSDILLDNAEELVARARPDALLLLSGILWEDSFTIRTRFVDLGCRVVKLRMMEEYCTVLLSRFSGE